MESSAILELGVEELPSAIVRSSLDQLQITLTRLLSEQHVRFADVSTAGSSRRLIVHIGCIALRQEETIEKEMGPPRRVVYDESGILTAAGKRYLRAKGASEQDLAVESSNRGEYVYIRRNEPGMDTITLLVDVYRQLLESLHFQRPMRWNRLNFSFGRPLRYILALLDDEVVPFEIGGINAGRMTRGHHYLSRDWLEVSSVHDYWNVLDGAHVVPNPDKRVEMILRQARKIAASIGDEGSSISLVDDEQLLFELAYLSEHPTVFRGEFSRSYLSLPDFVLKACLREHQKYFMLADKNGALPYFLSVRDGGRRNLDAITANHERVLQARLQDAEFFYREDMENALEDRVSALENVLVHEKLGNYLEKTTRLVALLGNCLEILKIDKRTSEHVRRAAYLCKADLTTAMVREFSDLQGMVGEQYAHDSGEPEVIARAIGEHRHPRFPGDTLPQSQPGAILAILDKIDTLCGAFCKGFIPSGSEDPWGLRRAAQGITEIIIERRIHTHLNDLIKASASLYGECCQENLEQAHRFVLARLIAYLREEGFEPEHINAVLNSGNEDLTDIAARTRALSHIMALDNAHESMSSAIRILRILRQANQQDISIPGEVRPQLFQYDQEKALHQCWTNIKQTTDRFLHEHQYVEAYQELAGLSNPIDRFFDEVMVMTEEIPLRLNRLSLLAQIGSRYLKIGDVADLKVSQD